MPYEFPRLLTSDDDVAEFACQSLEQTNWLRQHAHQSQSAHLTRVFVVTAPGTRRVCAYYAWTMAQIRLSDAPTRLAQGAGRYPQPVALLARLAVDDKHAGRGLGAGLLQDVVQRSIALSDEIGCRGLLVHAESEQARNFYRHLIPEFMESPTDPLHLVLLMKDVRRTLGL
jgi:GNAT superfamily N-acetyltransferase